MPGTDRSHGRHPLAVREIDPYARPFLAAGKRRQHIKPFGLVKKEEAWAAAAAGGCIDPITILVALASLSLRCVGAHIFQTQRSVCRQFVEMLHQHSLGKYRQFVQWTSG